MVGHSMTRAPRSSNCDRNSADCRAARVMRTVLPVSSIPGDFGKDLSRSHVEQLLAKSNTQFRGVVWRSHEFFRDHASSVDAGNQAFDREPVSFNSCPPGKRNLAASA